MNGNGIQDIGEPGLPNVIAVLYDCGTNTVVARDTTDGTGNYLFDFLLPLRSYRVQYLSSLLPPGYGFTFQDQGGNDQLDSDVNASGVGPCTYIEPGERDTTYDVGLVRLASIGDFVWQDLDGDGVQEVGEGGIQGVLVFLYVKATNQLIRTTTSGVNGAYKFENLMPQNYFIRFQPPAGYAFTTPNQGSDITDSDVDNSNGLNTTATTYLAPGENDMSWDAGLYGCGMIAGDVWLDLDMDGIYDPNEKGINGLRVYIIDSLTKAIVATLTTSVKPGTPSDDGYYKATCLRPGKYYVLFERPGHLGASLPYQGGNPNKDSDITHENGVNTTRTLDLLSGSMFLNIGAGWQQKAVMGDKVWVDQNSNGIQELGEPPLSNVKVAAYTNSGRMVSEGQTKADGSFVLDGMIQGDYYVKFDLPNGSLTFTIPDAGTDDVDSDVDGTFGYGTTKMYRILAGEVKPTIDAGVVSQVLSVEWLDFDGHYNGTYTQLDWSTRVDLHNDHFIVERRHESETDFRDIGRVAAQTDYKLSQHDYRFDDYQLNSTGVYYYRLKQVDKSGAINFSKIISVNVDGDAELDVDIYPNPADDRLEVELWIPEDTELEARIFDQSGKSVLFAPFNGHKAKGQYRELLDIVDLIPGQYLLQIKTSKDLIHKKFTISR